MSRIGPRVRFATTASLVALVSFACTTGGAASPVASGPVATQSPRTSAPALATAPGPTIAASQLGSGSGLAVLADGQGSAKELWILTASGTWQDVGGVPGATALSRAGTGFAIASGHSMDVRAAGDPSHTGTVTALKWPGLAPSAPIVGLDATGPAIAFVTADETSMGYGTAGADGTVTPVAPAPSQSFSPIVARLDASRLVVMTMDSSQVSRLAVIDTANHTLTTSKALGGIRDFALSADRQSVALATASGAYVTSVSSFMAGKAPQQVATVKDADVVWGLALDATGTQLFMLSGTVGPDGTVGSVHEVGYSRQGTGWTKSMDSATPFTSAVDQVCLG
jgi:hypothetical protein